MLGDTFGMQQHQKGRINNQYTYPWTTAKLKGVKVEIINLTVLNGLMKIDIRCLSSPEKVLTVF